MTKSYCDKCGKECIKPYVVTLPTDTKNIFNNVVITDRGVVVKYYDLCEDCFKELKNWINLDKLK